MCYEHHGYCSWHCPGPEIQIQILILLCTRYETLGFRACHPQIQYLLVPDTTTCTRAPWRVETEGVWESGRSGEVSVTFSSLSPWKQVLKTLVWEVLSLHPEERNVLIFKTEGHQEKSGQTGLAKFPLICYTYRISPWLSTLHQT